MTAFAASCGESNPQRLKEQMTKSLTRSITQLFACAWSRRKKVKGASVDSQLRSRDPLTPTEACLPLLPSGSDGVHKHAPQRARPSSPLIQGRPSCLPPRETLRLHCSGLWIEGTASPPPSTGVGGGGGIRTRGTPKGTPVLQTGGLDRSPTPPNMQ